MKCFKKLPWIVLMFALLTSLAFSESSRRAVTKPQTLGAEDTSKVMNVTVWLKQHNKTQLDELVRQMYNPNSPNFRHFLTRDQYYSRFAPTAADAAQVRDYLAAHNLTVVQADKHNHYLTAQGRVGDVQDAFRVQIYRVVLKGKTYRMAASEPSVDGPAAAVVAAVQVSNLSYSALAAPSRDLGTGLPYGGVQLTPGVNPNGLFFTGNCFRGNQTKTFKTPGGGPTAVYSGNRYGSNITSGPPNLPPCGYDAGELAKAYGLKAAFKKGWDGTGQTIVIVDAFGSNTILDDANEFSTLNNLPALTDSNFQIFTPNGSATCTSDNGCIAGNWQFETTLDVESAHAMAPGANIALVLGADNSFTNLDIANLFAIDNLLGNVISNSFGIPEIVLIDFLPSELIVGNGIAETAAALGISLQVSTGDAGDNLILDQDNFGIDSVSAQGGATTPFATAVGGTSLFLNGDHTIKFQTGWGLNLTRIADVNPNPPTIPPLVFGFQEGAGGGASTFFAKPKFQEGLRGRFRQTPDISMLADPQTGIEIIVTPTSVPGDPQFVDVFGGTSLSAPMFTGVWAIANQVAGGPLGEAAPYVYKLTGDAISDVTDLSSPLNVAGVIFAPPNPPLFESPDALAGPLDGTTNYISVIYNSPASTRWDVLTFGTDSSLKTGTGWDNVTGVGTPNGLSFIQQVVSLATSKVSK